MKNKLHHFIKANPLFSILLCFFFVLHGFTQHYDFIPVKDSLLLTGLYIFVTLVITGLCWLFYRNLIKSALVSSFIMAYHFFFGAVHDFLKKYFEGAFITKYSFILPV